MLDIDIKTLSGDRVAEINKKYTEKNKKKQSIEKSNNRFMNGRGIIMEFQTENYGAIISNTLNKLSLVFALQTGKIFEETKLGDQQTHNKTMETCIDLLQIFEEMSENDIIINYGCDDIQYMMMNEPNMKLLLPNEIYDRYYVVVFIDNIVFIVMRDECGYMLRDAREKNQLNFTDVDDLQFYLYKFYDIGDTNYAMPFKYYIKKC